MKKIIKCSFFLIIFIIIVIFTKKKCENYTINMTSSLQKGIYKLSPPVDIKKNDIVLFSPPAELFDFLKERGYLPAPATTLLKRYGGDSKSKLELINSSLLIDNKVYLIKKYDSVGRQLPSIKSSKIKTDEFLAIGDNPKSFDSRYFGAVKKSLIKKKAVLVFKF